MIACIVSLTGCAQQPVESRDLQTPTSILPLTEEVVNANVVNVIDGVTIEVDIEGQTYTVSYLGAKLPDMAQEYSGSSIFRQALEFNRFLVEGKTVQLAKGTIETDARGNLLRYVYVDGAMANHAVIANGYAVVSDFPSSFAFQTDFLLAEEESIRNLAGIWNISRTNNSSDIQEQVDSTDIPKFGGTLPSLPSTPSNTQECDFSGTSDPLIKAVTNSSGEQLFYLPENPHYASVILDKSRGDKLMCTRFEAMLAGYSEAD
jgi:endonuclease YncB( thermonuclease family)